MQEFEAIQQFFTRPTHADLGIGDDAALLQVTAGHQLVISTDMSVANTHFFAETPAFDIGWKSMAVNVSDMAAMGALPKWATLAMALPQLDAPWLQAFAEGLFACANDAGVGLIGGDTTRGPLNIAITIMGEVPIGLALRRDGAQVGDDIWVSGTLGQAALWLQDKQGLIHLDVPARAQYAQAMHRPQPRWQLGLALRALAHSALDISDGLLADLSHMLKASHVGATLDWDAIPKPDTHRVVLSQQALAHAVLSGGDDYELCFCAAASQRDAIGVLAEQLGLPLRCIGRITASPGLTVYADGQPMTYTNKGYDHFA